MGLFDKIKENGGLMNIIRCDEPSYLIWKWHPEGSQQGRNRRENAIRWGSVLRVKDGEVAVFVYRQETDIMQDFIVGPFDQIIKTENLPVLSNIMGLAYNGDTPFQAEIYFINLAHIIQVKFVVPFFDVYDPRFLDFGVPVAVRGTLSFRIEDYREFTKLHRLKNFDVDDFQKQIRDVVSRYVKDVVAITPAMHNIPLVQIESKTAQINDVLEYDLGERLKETFGIVVSGIDIGAIEIDKTSEGYRQLMLVTRDISAATVKAETEAKIKDIAVKQRIEAENYEEMLRIEREENQYALHKKTQSANIGAFQIEKQAEVSVAGAEAMGRMGENGAGDINLSGGGTGFNMATMMASMALGGVVGKNIAGSMNDIMSEINKPSPEGMTPPPIPVIAYYVAINGQAVGPYDINALKQMTISHQISADSFAWKNGMTGWEKIKNIDELKTLLDVVPPIP